MEIDAGDLNEFPDFAIWTFGHINTDETLKKLLVILSARDGLDARFDIQTFASGRDIFLLLTRPQKTKMTDAHELFR